MREDWTIQLPCLGLTVPLFHNSGKITGSTIIDAQTVPAGGKYAKIQFDGSVLLFNFIKKII